MLRLLKEVMMLFLEHHFNPPAPSLNRVNHLLFLFSTPSQNESPYVQPKTSPTPQYPLSLSNSSLSFFRLKAKSYVAAPEDMSLFVRNHCSALTQNMTI